MRKQVLLLFILLLPILASAQDDHVITDPHYRIKKTARCPKVLIDLSTGFNNNGGILGVGADYHFIKDMSIHGGLGTSTWGGKFYGGFKVHMRPCHVGWAFGGGLTYNTGIQEMVMDLPTIQGQDETVRLRYVPQTNVFIAGYRSWYVGRNRNRIYMQLGYSVPTNSKKYEQLSGSTITKEASRTIRGISPGGIIVALGFSLGV
jgi:hypothetical protein